MRTSDDGRTPIRGVVRPGRREAAGFVVLPWVVERLRRCLDAEPFPGTLNLHLPDRASRLAWARLRLCGPRFELLPPGPEHCPATCHPVEVNGEVRAVAVVPHVPGYPPDTVEVIAGTRLRDRLGLADGDEVRLDPVGDVPERPFDALLFDLEGTLVDFQWRLEEAEAELRRAVIRLGIEPLAVAGENYAGIRHRALELAGSPGLRDRIERALAPIYDAYDLDAESRWSLRQGAAEALERLAAAGVPLALVTNIGRRATDRALERLGIAGLLGAVVTRDDVTGLKPSGEGILKALASLGRPPERALMVGDSASDVGAARAAGVRVLLVSGGESEIRALGPHLPDALIPTLEDLPPLVL